MRQVIRKHVLDTYVALRVGMTVIAFGLPFFLVLGTWMIDPRFGMLDSLSSYYHTPMRDVFVGALATIGVCLHVYKGVNPLENLLLNIAGILAVFVAFLPVRVPDAILQASPYWLPRDPFTSPVLHAVFAIIFFSIIAFVCIKGSRDIAHPDIESFVVKDDRSAEEKRMYTWVYWGLAVLMVVSPIAAAILTFATNSAYMIFAAETTALWVFATFWVIKGRELGSLAALLDDESRAPYVYDC